MDKGRDPLSTETLQSLMESSTTAASRLLVGLVAASLTVTYLCASLLGWLKPFERALRSGSGDVRARVERDIRTLEPVLELSDVLRKRQDAVRAYVEFVRPLFALDNAASNAIVGADVGSQAWKGIDPIDLERVRDANTGLTGLSIALDFYSADDLRTSGLGAFPHFLRAFVAPDRMIDDDAVRRQLEADARVVRALGQTLSLPESLPQSIRFRDFVEARLADRELLEAVDAARAVPNPDSIVDLLAEVGDRSGVRPLTVAAIQRHLRAGEFVVPPDTSTAEPVRVSFMPIGVNRNLLVLSSPLALLFVLVLLCSQLERRAELGDALSTRLDAVGLALLRSQWFVSRPAPGGRTLSRGGAIARRLLVLFALLGQVSPVVAIACVAIVLARLDLPAVLRIGFWVSTATSLVATIGPLVRILRMQGVELRATPVAAGGMKRPDRRN